MSDKRALITGITGQDGSYLAGAAAREGLRGARHGAALLHRDVPAPARFRDEITLHTGDLLDQRSLVDVMRECEPDEIYNLAAMSFVAASWNQPVLTAEFTGDGRHADARGDARGRARDARFYQASSSEMFGKVLEVPQSETTPFYPRCPYGVAKAYGHFLTVNYRESYDLFACSGILFNHEVERRGLEFVTRKITQRGRDQARPPEELALGNLDAERDWGYATDYVEAMWLMLQQDEPDDYVIATGEAHSVRELVEIAFDHVGLDPDEPRPDRSALPAPGRGGAPHRRRVEGAREARLGAAHDLRGDRPADGRRRPRAAR